MRCCGSSVAGLCSPGSCDSFIYHGMEGLHGEKKGRRDGPLGTLETVGRMNLCSG